MKPNGYYTNANGIVVAIIATRDGKTTLKLQHEILPMPSPEAALTELKRLIPDATFNR